MRRVLLGRGGLKPQHGAITPQHWFLNAVRTSLHCVPSTVSIGVLTLVGQARLIRVLLPPTMFDLKAVEPSERS